MSASHTSAGVTTVDTVATCSVSSAVIRRFVLTCIYSQLYLGSVWYKILFPNMLCKLLVSSLVVSYNIL